MKTRLQSDAFLVIDEAINDQRVVQLKINTSWHTIEPYMIGRQKNTKDLVIYAYCRDIIPCLDAPSRWQIFNLDDISAIELTNYSFQPHIDYDGQDDSMLAVYRKLKPLYECEREELAAVAA